MWMNKNMEFKRTHLLLGLLVVLVLLYAINIYNLGKINNSLLGNYVKLSLVIINPSQEQCDNCFNTEGVVNLLASSNEIKITKKDIITPNSSKYKNLVEKNGIKNLPAIILSGDIESVKIAKMIKSLHGVKENGNIIIQNLLPYYDIKTHENKGLINVVLLKDKSCSDCFNVTQYLYMLKRFGMVVATSSTYDVSSTKGKSYVKEYNIKKVPTLIMSPEAGDYPGFRKSWKSVGTDESNGWFVFRNVQSTGGKFSNI